MCIFEQEESMNGVKTTLHLYTPFHLHHELGNYISNRIKTQVGETGDSVTLEEPLRELDMSKPTHDCFHLRHDIEN